MIIFKKAVALVVLDNKARSFSFRHSTQFRTAGLWIRMVDSQFFACCYYHISTENCCESINTGVEVFLALGSLPNTLNRWHSVPWSLVLFKYKFFQITCIVYDNTMCHVIHVLCLKPTSPKHTHHRCYHHYDINHPCVILPLKMFAGHASLQSWVLSNQDAL